MLNVYTLDAKNMYKFLHRNNYFNIIENITTYFSQAFDGCFLILCQFIITLCLPFQSFMHRTVKHDYVIKD